MNTTTLSKVRHNYLDLMQAWLTGSLWQDGTCAPFAAPEYDAARREHGLDWPSQALTMIGVKRLTNLRELTQTIISDRVQGDLIETGVWRGGACIMMRAILFSYGITDKRVWVADSFAGLPPGDPTKYPLDADSDFHTYDQLAIPLSEVQENFKGLGFLDQRTQFLKGWFRDTLPGAPIDQLALMRLDGDMYESTLDALDALYPKLSVGGFVIIDDYHVVAACRAAVHDYCTSHGLSPDIKEIDGVGVFWRKGDTGHTGHTGDIDAPAKPLDTIEYGDSLTQRILNADSVLRSMALSRTTQVLAQQNVHIAACLDSINTLKSEVERRDADLARRDLALKAIETSSSWRLTAPLRAFKKLAQPFFTAGK